MANQPNQKLKLLYLWKILLEKTDDVNGITTQEIVEELAYYGIDAERKGIYRDMDALRDFGYKIEQRKGKFWYLATRPMDLQEMIMLVDAVQSSPFLTEELTDRLIERIRQLASADQRKMLQRRIEVPGRIKMKNESALENLDVIQQAMRRKCKVEFKYFEYDLHKQKVLRRGGYTYCVTPVRLIYADELYYLISFMDQWADKEGHQPFTPYRVDRMTDVRVSDEPATRDARIATYETEKHISPSFGVYAADKVSVKLEFDRCAMNQIVDKFGLGALVFEVSEDRAKACVDAPLSPSFYGWLLQLAPNVRIVGPQRAIDEFNEMLTRAHRMYRGQYRILSERSRALSQEQFLELVGALETALEAKVAELPQGGFETEAAFNDFAWEVIEPWMVEHGIDDGMPKTATERRMVKDKVREVPCTMDSRAYEAYGQVVGEAMLAVEPRKWAAPEAKDTFFDTAARYGGDKARPFRFRRLPPWGRRDPSRIDFNDRYKYFELNGGVFEMWQEPGEKYWRCRFSEDKPGVAPVYFEPWLGGTSVVNVQYAADKHWQKIAYRFS